MIFDGKNVLVTGGTGSLGKVLIRRLLSGEVGTPRRVVVLSRDEAKQNVMRLAFMRKSVDTDEVIYRNYAQRLQFRIGDVRDYADICAALVDSDVVINAAALKQVPTCEYAPDQALLTNCGGATNIVRAIREHRYAVETVVGVSTDKACKPVNVMGMTKAMQERIFISGNIGQDRTRLVVVRYGNVLASRGSVIPLFHDQIQRGGPVTITAPEMTRFLISLEEAVDMIFASVAHGQPGETFVPITPSATVLDIARGLIEDRDIAVEVTGVRPGEKYHEVLVSEEERHRTHRRAGYYAIAPMLPELQSIEQLEPADLDGEYSSADGVVGAAETAALLRKRQLLVGEADFGDDGELLR